MDFIVTTLTGTNRAVVRFYNQRGMAGQWIKEGKAAAFEEMMEDAAKQIGTKRSRPLPQGSRLNHFAPWREYLEVENVLTKDQGGMTQQLYNYLSNAGSHQLGAGPKAARLSKNMVIELGLMVVEEVTRIS